MGTGSNCTKTDFNYDTDYGGTSLGIWLLALVILMSVRRIQKFFITISNMILKLRTFVADICGITKPWLKKCFICIILGRKNYQKSGIMQQVDNFLCPTQSENSIKKS